MNIELFQLPFKTFLHQQKQTPPALALQHNAGYLYKKIKRVKKTCAITIFIIFVAINMIYPQKI